jgi:hydrogenase large subunit
MTNKTIFIEPMTRIEGHLGVRVDIDVDKRVVVDAHSTGVMFRGFEKIMEGRDPPDAIWISQRICGVCPTPHAIASAEALDMALNVSPPPMAILLRNLADAFEIIYDHTLHWFQLSGPDYSEAIVGERNPSWMKAAEEFAAENRDAHGFSTVGEIMKAMVPLQGSLWLESIAFQRTAKECLVMVAGKYPHLATVIPGGITVSTTIGRAQEMLFKFLELIPWVKKMVFMAEDVFRFLEEMGYEKVGERSANLISYGAADDPELYDAKYENMDEWGVAREVTPGVVIDGELVTNRLTEIHLGVQEFVTHSFYEEWDGKEVEKDPLGNEVSARHPWNKDTRPKPAKIDWNSKYSWVTAPRWVYKGKVHVVEAGPIARMWTTAASRKVEGSTGSSLKFALPKTNLPRLTQALNDELELEWKIPDRVNVIERLRARIYYLAYMTAVAYSEILKVLDYLKKGKLEVFREFERPKWSLGVGLTEAGRGALGHWIIVKDGKIHRYQVITPSNFNASPKDGEGRRGPYEEALLDTPILEEGDADSWEGVDVVRTIRSMDPCLACGVTVYKGGRKVEKVING